MAPVSYAKLKAQVQSGNYEWDITATNQTDWLRAEREGFVEPIDWTIVQKDKLFPDAVFANGGPIEERADLSALSAAITLFVGAADDAHEQRRENPSKQDVR